MPDRAVTFADLSLGYGRQAVLTGLDHVVRRGSLTAVVGANGSGKSTLMRTIAGILRPIAGRCAIGPNLRLAYLPQQSELDRSFPARTIDLIGLGLWPRRGLLGRHRAGDRRAVRAALAAVGLEGFANIPLDRLSGGQMQRALFARVLVQDADLILLDEPFNAIDSQTVAVLLGLIRHWHAEGRTIMTVLHDLDLAQSHFPEILRLTGIAEAEPAAAHRGRQALRLAAGGPA
ncbi:zinc ABC transporter ATP-binding protein AztA [Labrys neptuniae]|uniref:zinc ABC transporter ATP-binding protein AztA n=1 Tax=Labrys neptuniae TaxID=376174 RepID=UPI00288E3C24|nr:zinc ABC transporter ATP-binding protein AztA [Labrys neptuniae]MDT3382311.1 zinc ABC transporter ATP-binding protein AztA [Labrys neptuniae]